MIRINLLPFEIQTVEYKFNPNIVIAGVVAAVIVCLAPVTLVQYRKRSRLQAEATALQSELDRYKPIVAQVEALEAAKGQLQQRKSIIQQLEAERLRYPYFMEDFLKLMPNNIWITSMSTSLPPDGATMTLQLDVIALDHYAVADLVSNLETSQIFTEVELGSINLTQGANGPSINFHVSTTYRKSMVNINAAQK